MRLRVWLGVVLVATVACGRRPSVPRAGAPSPSLGVAVAPTATAPQGPVAVTYFAPVGETHGGQLEVSVSFDRPMVELGRDAVDEGVFTIEPHVAGRARWVGSQTLAFEPSAPFPMGSEFTVRAAGLKALDGSVLAQPLSFRFATPALALASYDASQQPEQRRKTPFELRFNAPVDPAQLSAFASLTAHVGKRATEVAFTVEPTREANVLRVVPRQAYPIAARVVLALRAGLVGREGPRPLAHDEQAALEVYGPLRLLPTPACDDDCVPRIAFSNPVRTRDVYARLVFDPPLPTPLVRDDDYLTDQLYFGPELAPGTTYRVRVEGPLRDAYGTQLSGERTVEIRTPPYPPYARLLMTGDQRAPAPGELRVRAQLQHLDRAQLDLYPLAADEVWPTDLDAIRPRAPAHTTRFGALGPVERKIVEVDAAPALRAGKGLLLASLHGRGPRTEFHERKLLAFGDLAPSLKVGQRDGVVWVTRLSSAQPVAGARVRVVHGKARIASGVSDERGVFAFALGSNDVAFDQGDDNDLAAVVELGDELAFTRKFAGMGPWESSDRGSWGGDGNARAHLFSERGIYRPGDTVQLKGILRRDGAQGPEPAQGSLELRAVDASDSVIETATIALNGYGTFAHALRVPGSVELGPLSMRVTYQGQSFQHDVELAEYRPAELEASLAPQRERALQGEQVPAKLSAQYLFGAPAQGARVYWTARYLGRTFEPAAFPGFSFHDRNLDRDGDYSERIAGSGEGQLDAHGELDLLTTLSAVPKDGPSTLELEASVDVQGTQASARAYVETWPANLVVGVKPATTLSAAGQPLAAELIALTPDGTPRAGVKLHATFARRSYLRVQRDGGVHYEAHDERVASCTLTSASAPLRCTFQPVTPGLHVLRVRGKDAQGRVSAAAEYVYVSGAGVAAWDVDDERKVELKSARKQYALGETARILVPSPFPEAEALITVEREGVLSSQRTRLGPAGTIDIAIDQRFVPNAFVSVLLVRPLDAAADVPGPAYRVGTLELAADVSARRLAVDVQLDPPASGRAVTEKRPGDELRVALAVADGHGKPVQSELTVFAVDEGVLALTGYRTPDPFSVIYAPRGLGVWTSDVRASLLRAVDASDEDKGGDEGGGGGSELRSNFSALAAYVPSVETDAQGRAELRFKLPDSTTRYRVMAVAASRGAELGAGEASVRTRKPLLMRALLPRVLRAGDAVEAGVMVHNDSDAPFDSSVQLELRGLTATGAREQRVVIPAHGAVPVRFALRAERVGEAQLTFRVRAGSERDALSLTRSVLSPSVLETMSVAGVTAGQAQESLAALDTVRDDVGGLSVTLAASALSELEQPARQLFAYPYGCSEQLASRLIALAALERLRVPLALPEPSFAATAEPLVAELERHQSGDGSFGLWRANDGTSPELRRFLTAYALLALDQLTRAKLALSPHALERARAFLVRSLRESADELGARVFTVYALARTGKPEPGYANKLFEQRAQLDASGMIELAHALTAGKDDPARTAAVFSELSSHVRVATDRAHVETAQGGWPRAFGSDVRATAALLLMLLDHAPEHALVPKLARWLSEARGRDGGYANTQQSAWAVMALAHYLERREPQAPALQASVSLAGRALGQAPLSVRRARAQFALPMEQLPRTGASLTVSKTGRGTLYYGLSLRYASTELPRQPRERGFFIERSYHRIDPAELAAGEVHAVPGEEARLGDYVRVELRIAAPSQREFVMIEDALPAGLEPVDTQLTTEFAGAARALDASAPEDHRELREQGVRIAIDDLPPGLHRYSYLARASTPGTFVVPPARVEEMYHPDTQGLSAATQFTVLGSPAQARAVLGSPAQARPSTAAP